MRIKIIVLIECLFVIACSHKKHVKQEYFESGELKKKVTYENKNDTTSFTVLHYYKNGSIKIETKYVKGKREGKYKIYFPDGRIDELYNYKNGLKHGKFSSFNDQGFLMKENYYYKNKLILHKIAQFSIENKIFRHVYYKPENDSSFFKIGYIDYDEHGNVFEKESFFYDVISMDTVRSKIKIKFYNKKDDFSLIFEEKGADGLNKAKNFGEVYQTLKDTLTVDYKSNDLIVGTIFLKKDTFLFDYPFYYEISSFKDNAIGIPPLNMDSVKVE